MRLVLVLCGGAGLLLLMRALFSSPGVGEGSAFASGLYAVMALGLAAGLVELWIRQRRSETSQLEMIQSLLDRGEALPKAASSLESVSAQLKSLQDSWAQAHESSAQTTLEIIRGAVTDFRTDMKRAVEDSGQIAKEAVTPLLEDVIERTSATARVHLGEVVESVARDFDARREAEGRHVELLTEQAHALAKSEEERQARLGGQWEELTTRLEKTMNASLARDLEYDRRLDDINAQQVAAVERMGALTEERGAALADALSAHGDRLAERLQATEALVAEAAALVKAGGAEMTGVAEMFGQAVDRQREAAGAWLESLGQVESALGGAVEDAVERAGRGAAADALRTQLGSTEELFARQLQFQRELFTQLRSLRTHRGDAEEPSEIDEPRADDLDDEVEVQYASGTPAEAAGV